MDTSMVIRIFGLGCIGVIGTMILNKAGKQDIAFILDIVLVLVAFGMAFKFVEKILNDLMVMFGV